MDEPKECKPGNKVYGKDNPDIGEPDLKESPPVMEGGEVCEEDKKGRRRHMG
jgi:hypothetical protein